MSETDQIRGHGRSEIILSQFSAAEREALLRDVNAREALAALSTYSPALTQALSARVELARWLFLERAFEKSAYLKNMPFELAAVSRRVVGVPQLQKCLRAFRLKEISRLAVRDLTGRADLEEVIQTLSALADACLQQCLATATVMTAERFNITPTTLGMSPIILGMGKLGARELNYSSDVDLVYLYQEGDSQLSGAPSVNEVAAHLFTLVTRAMSEVTEDGLVFRVDLNLRPGGKDGAQAQSVVQARKYYQIFGQPWERMALLKARPVAGDIEAGLRFLSELDPFIFRRHLDFTSLEELKDLKTRFNRERRTKISRRSVDRTKPALDVKLGSGGIREIEFLVQTLTLTFGGRLPHLRLPETLKTLAALATEGIIPIEDRDKLAQAYTFLRNVEHRLQLREMTQTQTIPKDQTSRELLARSLGFTRDPWPDFLISLQGHMDQVKKRFAHLLAEPGEGKKDRVDAEVETQWSEHLKGRLDDRADALEILAQAGFQRPDAALSVCLNIRDGSCLPVPLSRYKLQLERLFAALVAGAAETPDPDRAILHLEQFLIKIGPKAGLLVLLEENPKLIRLLSILFGHSDFLSEIMIKHPAVLDSLIDRRSAKLVKNRQTLDRELDTMLSREEDPETCLTVIRRFKNDETLRVGLYDLLGKLSLHQVQKQLTDLAEAVMSRTLQLVVRAVLPHVAVDDGDLSLVIMGLGKLGGSELAYGSDLDLIFIMGEAPSLKISMEEVVRLSQRFISYLSIPLEAGPGYEIDSRLRPSGGSGPLVVTTKSFENYHRTSQLWERQALLRIRRSVGPTGLGARVKTLANRAIYQRDLPDDAAEKIDHLRLRMSKERGRIKADTVNLKFSPGGLVDVEFLTQYLQLIHGRTIKDRVRSENTETALKALARSHRGPKQLAAVATAYAIISRSAMRLNLMYGRSGDRAAYSSKEIASLRLPEIEGDPERVLKDAMNVVRDVHAQVFDRKENHAV